MAGEACHSLIRVVLPKPAGAEMSVSGRVSTCANFSVRRKRGTQSGRIGGTNSFVFSSGSRAGILPGWSDSEDASSISHANFHFNLSILNIILPPVSTRQPNEEKSSGERCGNLSFERNSIRCNLEV